MNKEATITSFSLSDLKKMAGEHIDAQPKECLIVHSESSLEALHFPCRIDALIIGIGTEGEASFYSNLQEYSLQKNSLFIYVPNNIIHTPRDNRFKAQVMIITSDFIRHMHLEATRMMPLFIQFSTTPCIQLSDEEALSMRRLLSELEAEVNQQDTPFIREVIGSLVCTIIYKAGNLHHQYISQEHDESLAKKRGEPYFTKFMQLLTEHYKTERSVGFYAKQLCITPKYLTTLIRRISDKSVSEWIDNCVILEAKTLLKYSDMSIQEIAYYLNFPNQSFFGSYFKRNTGISPSQYKTQQ